MVVLKKIIPITKMENQYGSIVVHKENFNFIKFFNKLKNIYFIVYNITQHYVK